MDCCDANPTYIVFHFRRVVGIGEVELIAKSWE
jgi:hypothetical protein